MKPIADLIKEHGDIKLMLRLLEKIAGNIEAGESVDKKHLEKSVEFIREFADKCHHGKEEDLLFPAIKENNIPKEISLADVLIEEHDTGRQLVKGMSEATVENDFAKFAENARSYVKLLDQHIDKENTVLFPMADKSLSEEKQKELEAGFEDLEKNIIGKGRHEELHGIIHQLKEAYLH